MEATVYADRVREKLTAALNLAKEKSKSTSQLGNAFNRGRESGFREAIKIVNRVLHEKQAARSLSEEQFIERFRLWQKALGSDDPHSLVRQMYSVCWSIATYESIRASWKTEMAEDGDTLNVSPFLFHFITNDFSKGLCLDLRRLTEAGMLEEARQDANDRSVYSLASLLADIKENREAFTRKRLFTACGLEYDVDAIRQRHNDYVGKMLRSGASTWGVPHDLWDGPTVAAHAEWDRICFRTPSDRSPEDVIALHYLEFLENDISAVHNAIVFLVDKHLAHAATPESRESAKDKDTQVTINQLEDLTVKCGRLINSVSSILRGAMYSFLPRATWNTWESWGRGWAADPKTLKAAWQAWEDSVERLRPLYPPADQLKQ